MANKFVVLNTGAGKQSAVLEMDETVVDQLISDLVTAEIFGTYTVVDYTGIRSAVPLGGQITIILSNVDYLIVYNESPYS
jgi:hypothetical protein